jgi:signal transduction histidine kinase/ligand-binding sensor domain-containing protein
MKPTIFLFFVLLFLQFNPCNCQQVKFNLVIEQQSSILAMAQDPQGYIWFGTGDRGLFRYDGITTKTFSHDPRDSNSLASNYSECLSIDSAGIIWIGTFNAGLDRFDPSTNSFTHYRHNPKDSRSLASDTIAAILEDHLGNLWLGTYGGLDMFDKKTGRFSHYANKPGDNRSLSYNHVRVLYEDKAGELWVGCGSPFPGDDETQESGGLNRFDRATGKFTHYLHDPVNPASIATNKVRAILEDSKGNFWVGTSGDGLHTMDRKTGTFTHFYYDSTNPGKLSRPVLYRAGPFDHITFITEDVTGAIWIGTLLEGINRFDPVTKQVTHHGIYMQDERVVSFKDTLTGLKHTPVWNAMISKDGLLWICTINTIGTIYNINAPKSSIPFYEVNNGSDANTFYYEKKENILWIGTDKGLLRKNLTNQGQKVWLHDPLNKNSLANDTISAMRADSQGNLWITTNDGLCKFDRLNTFTTFRHIEGDSKSISSNALLNLFIDKQHIWICTDGSGMDMLDLTTGIFSNYSFDSKDSTSLSNNRVISICSGGPNSIWAATHKGLNYLDTKSGKFRRYLLTSSVKNIFVDASGIAWAGTIEGLYYFDKGNDAFIFYLDPGTKSAIPEVLHIMEDAQQNLWVSTANSIIKINSKRDRIKVYGGSYGIHQNTFLFSDNSIGENGQLFIGDQDGYYSFFPGQLKENDQPPIVNLTSFRLGDAEVRMGQGSILKAPIWQTKELNLNYKQNIFSFDFNAISYKNQGSRKYLFMLENYDNSWHDIGTDHKAYFFNVPPGKYIFRVRSVIGEDNWGETSIRIIITPPWWKTWWAYTLFALLFISLITAFVYYRSKALRRENRILEEKVAHRTQQLNKSLQDLKSTQSQLIQSEKMASLGELTAGIAHEIQNPLNFVNNFSEVNTELIEELQEEIDKGNFDDVKAISIDIKENQQKINHHGKRADAIVKGMLQHSRSNTGVKESTDINALADEYLRLAYHGLRAKDKSFNATLKTDFDKTIGSINIIPQDIGRVILNLITNAFYAVTEKNASTGSAGQQYEPTVSLTTKKTGNHVAITVADNGNGISQKILDKIFQPFFTTKPTGEGTGLGLSLSYDIVKAHGGELKVETKEGEGSEFVIQL